MSMDISCVCSSSSSGDVLMPMMRWWWPFRDSVPGTWVPPVGLLLAGGVPFPRASVAGMLLLFVVVAAVVEYIVCWLLCGQFHYLLGSRFLGCLGC